MPFMHDMKFRKEPEAKKKGKKERKKKEKKQIAMDTQKPD